MYVNSELACCGIREICNLAKSKSAEAALKSFTSAISPRMSYYGSGLIRRDKFRYAIFSGTIRSKYAERFSTYLIEHQLGDVIATGYHRNPNSHHMLKVWVWTVDHNALAAWKAVHMQPIQRK